VSWLWQQLMGRDVYPVASTSPSLRAYLHGNARREGYTLLLINMDERPVPVTLRGLGAITGRFVVTAKRLVSKKVSINGVRPALRRGRVTLEDFPQPESPQSLPPYSISFWELDESPVPRG
jgi:heparanase 1